jgi:hypothetical protein
LLFLQIYSDEDTTDTEPSAEKEQEQEEYSKMYEDSPDQAFENHTQVIVNSEETDCKLDCREYPKIQSVLARQNTEVHEKRLDDIKYEAGDFDDKLDCTEYTDIQTEQNTETDAENANETECEADTENVNERECEADNFSQQYELQNTEVQEGSYDMQIHDGMKHSEPSAASMDLRNGRAVKKVTLVCTHTLQINHVLLQIKRL